MKQMRDSDPGALALLQRGAGTLQLVELVAEALLDVVDDTERELADAEARALGVFFGLPQALLALLAGFTQHSGLTDEVAGAFLGRFEDSARFFLGIDDDSLALLDHPARLLKLDRQ